MAGMDFTTATTSAWFRRWGWVYRPVHPFGYLALLAAVAFLVHTFLVLDARAHSVSDLLYHFYAYAAPTFLGLMWVCSRTCAVRGDGA
jgi:hypothetical protein